MSRHCYSNGSGTRSVRMNPDFHHFDVLDLSISYPYCSQQKVSKVLLVFIFVVFPVVTITLFCHYGQSSPLRGRHPRLTFLNISLLGPVVSLATTVIFVTAFKNLTGKRRPDFLATCQPDLSVVPSHTVGGYGQLISTLRVMVDAGICQKPDGRIRKCWKMRT